MAKLEDITKNWPEDIMKKYEWLDEYLLQQQETVKEFQTAWQANKYLLKGKMYAYIGVNDQNDRPIITLKLEPAYSDLMRSQYEDIIPGYYMNKMHWSTIYLDGSVPQEVIKDVVSTAYDWVLASLSKKAQREILGE